jgi:hypothetical protein
VSRPRPPIVEPDGKISINNPQAAAALNTAKGWIGTITPGQATDDAAPEHLADDRRVLEEGLLLDREPIDPCCNDSLHRLGHGARVPISFSGREQANVLLGVEGIARCLREQGCLCLGRELRASQ